MIWKRMIFPKILSSVAYTLSMLLCIVYIIYI